VNPLAFAAGFRVDRSVDLGSVALRVAAYRAEGEAPGAPIDGLRVVDVARGDRALWHGSTGVYGFLNLPAGPRRFRITDPARRWLEREVEVDVPDREALRAALIAGAAPPVDPGPTWVDVPMYPTIELAIPSSELVVWGVVSRGGAPVAGAMVRVDHAPPLGTARAWRGATDAQGVYVVWLRGFAIDDPDAPVVAHSVRAWGPVAPAAAVLPADFDALDPALPAFASRFGVPGAAASPVLPLGARTRVDLVLP
jgi:hypothetical protein